MPTRPPALALSYGSTSDGGFTLHTLLGWGPLSEAVTQRPVWEKR